MWCTTNLWTLMECTNPEGKSKWENCFGKQYSHAIETVQNAQRGVQWASVILVCNISRLGTAYSCNIPSRTCVIPLLQYTVRKKMLWEWQTISYDGHHTWTMDQADKSGLPIIRAYLVHWRCVHYTCLHLFKVLRCLTGSRRGDTGSTSLTWNGTQPLTFIPRFLVSLHH